MENSSRIHKGNVGRIAERIVSNELEFRGFRVSDLNKEGPSANADLLAAKDGDTWQIQVKGSTEDGGWWYGYGHCNEATIANTEPMFNRHTDGSFYKAQIVVLVCVKSSNEYRCIVLPVGTAEDAAQTNLTRYYRTPRIKDGQPKKPGRVWVPLDHNPKAKDPRNAELLIDEQNLLRPYFENWNLAFEPIKFGKAS